MRIVAAMIEAPLPFGGAAGRWLYVLLRGLKERGHDVAAFVACPKASEVDEVRTLFPAPEYDVRPYVFPQARGLRGKLATLARPYSYMFSDEFHRDFQAELARGYDVIHLEQLWSGWLALGQADRTLVNLHYLASIDLGEGAAGGLGARLQARRIIGAERRMLRSFRRFRSFSERLVAPIRAVNPRAEVHVVPLGIDASLYPYIPDENRGREPIVSVIGSMGWRPSRSAAERLVTRLWPEIKRRVPNARLQIVGWSARSALKDYLDLPDVEVVENVPDVRPYFERTSVLVYAPGRGSGMKIKIRESMAFGVPVVTTSEGVEGLPAVDGEHAGIAEDDAGLIDRAVAILENPGNADRMRREARLMLERCCGPEPTVEAIEAIYETMLGRRPVAARG